MPELFDKSKIKKEKENHQGLDCVLWAMITSFHIGI
jgi:hypothetical protein